MDLLLRLAPYAIGLAAVYFGWGFIAPRLKLRVPNLTMDDVATRVLGDKYQTGKIERQAAAHSKAGNYLEAGRIYEEAGMSQQALDTYLKGEEYMAAAFTLEKMPGKAEKAGEYFLKAGDYKKAAEVFTTAGKPGKAAPLFEERGNNLEAARLYGLAQQWDKAAALFVKSGYPIKAAEAFEKKGDFMKAAESYEKHFMENVTFSTTYSGAPPASEMKNAFKAGQLYEKAGSPERAREIYLRGSFFKQAAQVCATLGQHDKAAEYLLRAEDLAGAADAYEKGGDAVKGANYRGEVAFKAGKIAEAAAFFRKGQDYQRSAELFEQVGMLKEAGGAYEEADSFGSAGAVYLRAGINDKAAACFERSGEYETSAKLYEESGNGAKAAELYDKAGLTFKSGMTAAAAGQTQKAIALLQRVATTDEHYADATEKLAELFVQGGNTGLAIERLEKALVGKPASADNLSLYYWLGRAHEAAQARPAALATFKKILAENFEYEDVVARVQALESGKPAASPAPARPPQSGTPAPASGPSGAGAAIPETAAPPPGPTAAVPAKAPRFVIKDVLAHGALGVIHRGLDTADNNKPVAMRLLPASAAPHLSAVMTDLKAVAPLSHPGVVRVLGAVDVQGQRAVVTEWVQGATLASPLKAGQKLGLPQVQGIARALAQALAFVHGKGFAHGSLQPSNVMSASGQIKLADLGLGRLHLALVAATPYRAPEARLDAAGDVFAFGALLQHLLAGQPPQAGVAVALPAPFDQLVPRCLDPKPEARPKAQEIAEKLGVKA